MGHLEWLWLSLQVETCGFAMNGSVMYKCLQTVEEKIPSVRCSPITLEKLVQVPMAIQNLYNYELPFSVF